MNRKDTGTLGEKLARDFLKERGYTIVESNYHCPHGEIDIVAHQGDFLVFIEVRTKTGFEFGSPGESVTPAKKGKLVATAFHYRQEHDDLPPLWRIDFVGVLLNRQNRLSRIELIENAIGED